MKAKFKNFQDALKEVEPLKQNEVGKMEGGFLPFGGSEAELESLSTFILNTVFIAVFGYACGCSCHCSC